MQRAKTGLACLSNRKTSTVAPSRGQVKGPYQIITCVVVFLKRGKPETSVCNSVLCQHILSIYRRRKERYFNAALPLPFLSGRNSVALKNF